MAVHAVKQRRLLVRAGRRGGRERQQLPPRGGGRALGVAHERLVILRGVLPRPTRTAEVAGKEK